MSSPEKPDVPDQTSAPEAGYEPPAVEDIDTTVEPADTAAGIGSPRLGVEESDRWH